MSHNTQLVNPVAVQGNPGLTPATGIPTDDYLLGKNVHANIIVPFLENVLGMFGVILLGIGIYGIIEALINIISGNGRTYLLLLILCIGVGIGGLMTAIHFFRDEWRIVYGLRNAKQMDKERTELTRALDASITRIKELESKLSVSDRYSALAMAEQLLREWFFEQKPMNRDTAMERGWTRSNWTLAFAHLKNSTVVDGKGALQVASYELAMSRALIATHGKGSYVRAQDGGWLKVGSNVPVEDARMDVNTSEFDAEVSFPKPVARRMESRTQPKLTTTIVAPTPDTLVRKFASRAELRTALSTR